MPQLSTHLDFLDPLLERVKTVHLLLLLLLQRLLRPQPRILRLFSRHPRKHIQYFL
jgi:hypothetical protein